jgi:hypothetical protein
MKVKRTEAPEKKTPERSFFISFQGITIIVIVVVAVLFFFWHQKNFRAISNSEVPTGTPISEISIPEPVVSNGIPGITAQKESLSSLPDETEGSGVVVRQTTGRDSGNLHASLDRGQSPSLSQDDRTLGPDKISHGPDEDGKTVLNSASLSEACVTKSQTIHQFYKHLDGQNYIEPHNLSPNSEVYFTKLIQNLLDNPPVVSGETDDLYTILQNTAHFFRIIGKENILIMKGILDREKDQFENVLAQFYSLLHIPSCPEQSFNLHIQESALYDYAGFFLNTMGGRLYLFRRDSMSRMVVSYYAVLLIDRANKNAENKHGIALKTAINQLIDEIESTANTLHLKEMYLDDLYTLKEQYQ